MKKLSIRFSGKRNEVKDKFGQGKNAYNLNRVRVKAAKTSESWIAAIFFVMNLVKFSKEFLFSILFTILQLFIMAQLNLKVMQTAKLRLRVNEQT
ncbi:MAG: hypothetical protein GX876_12885 [Bacteroidales bacterium]|nr:hypothetical protein [Bacteroidales bacterium]